MEKYLKYKAEDFVLDDDFRAFVLGKASSESSNRWITFREKYPAKQHELDRAVLILKQLDQIEDTKVPADRINYLWNRISTRKKATSRVLVTQFMKYAAVFLVALVIGSVGYGYLQSFRADSTIAYNEINVPYGERSEITLYDGTRVWLNSGTKLKFPTVFKSEERRIYLEGEAFFDVAKNKHQPFVVGTSSMDIEVLGTRFNVNAYPDEQLISATLEEGKIVAKNLHDNKVITLSPGYQAVLDLKSNLFADKKVDTELYTSWKENLLRFQDASFDDVITKMERWYDVDITINENLEITKLYTLTIKTESLREMLGLLSYTTPIKYEIIENKVFISKP